MSDDRRRPKLYAAERDAALAEWVPGVVHRYSDALRPVLDRVGGRRAVRRAADLAKLPVVALDELGDGRAFLLEPSAASVSGHGSLGDRMRLATADLLGRRKGLARHEIEPAFKPVVWTGFVPTSATAPTTVFVANTTTDVDRLTALGRRGLSISGVHPGDRILVLDPAGTGVAPWQFLAGARDAGVAVMHLDAADEPLVQTARPTVVAGGAASLVAALERGLPDSVRLLIAQDGRRPDADQAAALAASGVPLAEWWVPDGARAAWVRCPGGVGFHTWPTTECVEILDDDGRPTSSAGRLVWTPVGWHGSVWFRVDTGVRASLEGDACPTCSRTTPRVVPVERTKTLTLRPRRPRRRRLLRKAAS